MDHWRQITFVPHICGQWAVSKADCTLLYQDMIDESTNQPPAITQVPSLLVEIRGVILGFHQETWFKEPTVGWCKYVRSPYFASLLSNKTFEAEYHKNSPVVENVTRNESNLSNLCRRHLALHFARCHIASLPRGKNSLSRQGWTRA